MKKRNYMQAIKSAIPRKHDNSGEFMLSTDLIEVDGEYFTFEQCIEALFGSVEEFRAINASIGSPIIVSEIPVKEDRQ